MDGYHNIYLFRMVTKTPTYNERLPLHLFTMNGYHNIYLQQTITITSIYNEWLS